MISVYLGSDYWLFLVIGCFERHLGFLSFFLPSFFFFPFFFSAFGDASTLFNRSFLRYFVLIISAHGLSLFPSTYMVLLLAI